MFSKFISYFQDVFCSFLNVFYIFKWVLYFLNVLHIFKCIAYFQNVFKNVIMYIFALSHFHILKSASSPSHISTDGCNVVRPDEKLRRKIAPKNNIKWRYWTFFNLINISDGFDVVQLNEKTGTEYYFKSASEKHKNEGKMKIFKILNLINFSADGLSYDIVGPDEKLGRGIISKVHPRNIKMKVNWRYLKS